MIFDDRFDFALNIFSKKYKSTETLLRFLSVKRILDPTIIIQVNVSYVSYHTVLNTISAVLISKKKKDICMYIYLYRYVSACVYILKAYDFRLLLKGGGNEINLLVAADKIYAIQYKCRAAKNPESNSQLLQQQQAAVSQICRQQLDRQDIAPTRDLYAYNFLFIQICCCACVRVCVAYEIVITQEQRRNAITAVRFQLRYIFIYVCSDFAELLLLLLLIVIKHSGEHCWLVESWYKCCGPFFLFDYTFEAYM